MFPSVRRVVASSAAAPPAAAALVRSGHWSTQSSSASAAQIRPGQTIQPSCGQHNQHQQRRYSSSKPSSPDNGSKALPGVPSRPSNSSSSASSSSSSSSNSSSSSFKRKRKAKQDAARPSVQKLPSVPSTQHLPAESLALSTFFSQHRPISITHSLPKIVTDDAFAAIFAPRRGKSSDVIRTLSRAVDDLEGPMAGLSLNGNTNGPATAQPAQRGARARQAKEAQAAFARRQLQQQLEEDAAAQSASADSTSAQTQLEFKNADGSDAGIYVQLNTLSGQFLPFQPPPPPVPEVTEAEADAGESRSAAQSTAETAPNSITFEIADGELTSTGNSTALLDEDAEPRSTRVFKAILTIEEQLDDNGEVRIVAHSPQILEEGAEGIASAVSDLPDDVVPRSFFERMALRQLRFEDALQRQRDANSIANGTVVRRRLPSAYHDGISGVPRMLAISVRRQRKLKIKKKKYKKLMKRTRTLRRKLDRT